ncbi:MAG TPA: penicillin-binding protein 2 [Thermoanaerobaculales bacterium]|nr:penicillin-binding protein 2 [Thermoanaerobaculales bacterium]HQL28814.1 penicillin-binding protein 2 [Thermoanaerobaculales bacterium]
MELREDLAPVKRRAALLVALTLAALVVLLLRLVQLQIIEGASWRRAAENNRLRRIPVATQRGRIYDRRGVVLADNVPTWQLLLFPDEAPKIEETLLFVARLGIADVATLRNLQAERELARLAPLVLADDLSWEQVAKIRSHQSDHPELAVTNAFRRAYPLAGTTAHVVGHLRMVTRDEVEADPGLDQNALVGATGVEALRNGFLAGSDGTRYEVVSAVGQPIGVVRDSPPVAGRDVGTTLDVRLQQTAALALGDRTGTVVALEPATGAVRVLYSSPTFDPNIFVGRLSHSQWEELTADPGRPLNDRSLQGAYPPGSTIKPFYTLAGLAEGEITPDSAVTCHGGVTLYGHPFRCWRRGGHGGVGVVRSLEVSCDSFYYLLGYRLGIDRMARWLRRFGFAEPTGIGLGPELTGLVGTPEWAREVRGTPWYAGEAISVAIGQGPVLATSLQLARAYAVLANGGRLVTPHLVASADVPPPVDLGLDPRHLALVVEGLTRVVHGGEGTAAFLARLPMAGKTGTAQVARLREGVRAQDLPEHLRHHALFVGWAPLDRPRLVVAAVVEHGVGGSTAAAPVVAQVIEAAMEEWNGTHEKEVVEGGAGDGAAPALAPALVTAEPQAKPDPPSHPNQIPTDDPG